MISKTRRAARPRNLARKGDVIDVDVQLFSTGFNDLFQRKNDIVYRMIKRTEFETVRINDVRVVVVVDRGIAQTAIFSRRNLSIVKERPDVLGILHTAPDFQPYSVNTQVVHGQVKQGVSVQGIFGEVLAGLGRSFPASHGLEGGRSV